MGHIVLVLLPV